MTLLNYFLINMRGKLHSNMQELCFHIIGRTLRIAFKGQSAAQMGIIITLYIQQALASLLQQLNQESPNLDSMTQIVRNSFAMSSKVLD